MDELVDIESLSSEGDGVGRLGDGRVVFVAGAAPGDRVSLADIEESKRFVRASVGELVSASPDRVDPACAHFGRCGGCQWQHVAYPAQLQAKQRIVRDAFQRIARLDPVELPPIVASPDAYHYRARARWIEGEGGLGYRARGSREVEVVEACPVLVPGASAALEALREGVREARARRGDARPGGRAKEWIVTASGGGPEDEAIVMRPRQKGRPPSLSIELEGGPLRVSGDSFVQGNALLWDDLVDAVVGVTLGVAEPGAPRPRFVELYCGIGFFTVPLAASGARGAALESDRRALSDLAHNLRRAGLEDRVEILRGQAEQRGDLRDHLRRADVALVDPPRAGLAPAVREALADARPERIVYLSCDPGTLARDIADLARADYDLTSTLLFDLFPQTPHVETLVTLQRGGAR